MVDGTDLFRIQVVTCHANCRIHDKAMSINAAKARPHETLLAKIQETSELAVYGKEQIENLVKLFAPVLTEEEVEGVVKEFTSSRFT